MAILESREVFDLMGSSDEVRLSQTEIMDNLILAQTEKLEFRLGRSIQKKTISDFVLFDSINCKIIENKIYLLYQLRDFFKLTILKENENEIQDEIHLDKKTGILINKNRDFSKFSVYELNGDFGFVDETENPRQEIVELVKKMCAVASGLWKTISEDDGIEILINQLSEKDHEMISFLRLRD